jgi:short-subunit dehydrogenase
VLVSRSQADLELVATEVQQYGVETEILVADLVDRTQRALVADRLRSTQNPIDVLINNAGIGVNQRFVSGDLERELYMLELLVTAVLELSHAAAGQMKSRGTGKIVIVSSVASFIAGGTYSAAKTWTTVFAEGLSVELATSGVRVMALCPGFTHTEFHQRAGIRKADVPAALWLDVRDLVRTALVDLERGVVVSVPDWKYKTLVWLARSLPRKTVRNFGFKFRNKSRR